MQGSTTSFFTDRRDSTRLLLVRDQWGGNRRIFTARDVYRNAETGFQDRYLQMLRAGGTLRHQELLAPFGLDATDPAFWSKGLGVIAGFIDELEKA